MKKYKRIFLIVCDSMGVGDAYDAFDFGDEGANTLGHICEKMNGLNVPVMEGMGLGSIGDFEGIPKLKKTISLYCKMRRSI